MNFTRQRAQFAQGTHRPKVERKRRLLLARKRTTERPQDKLAGAKVSLLRVTLHMPDHNGSKLRGRDRPAWDAERSFCLVHLAGRHESVFDKHSDVSRTEDVGEAQPSILLLRAIGVERVPVESLLSAGVCRHCRYRQDCERARSHAAAARSSVTTFPALRGVVTNAAQACIIAARFFISSPRR